MKRCSEGPSLSDPGIFNDPGLLPHKKVIDHRLARAEGMAEMLTFDGHFSLYDVADYHETFGLHFRDGRWCFREWAPNASSVCIIGDMTGWCRDEKFQLTRTKNEGIWEGWFDVNTFCHGQHYRLWVVWPGGEGDRIPTAAVRVVQDPQTLIFTAQVWHPPGSLFMAKQ